MSMWAFLVWGAVVAVAAYFGARAGALLRGQAGKSGGFPGNTGAMPQPTPIAPKQTSDESVLLDYLVERFGPRLGTAAGAIDYFEKLAKDLEELEKSHADREASRTASPQVGWFQEMIANGGRLIQDAQSSLRREPRFDAFAREVKLPEIVRGLSSLHHIESSREMIEQRIPRVVDEAWFHHLLRADLLCGTYYPTTSDWSRFRLGLCMSSTALRMALQRIGVSISYVKLLAPIQADEAAPIGGGQSTLSSLVPVKTAIEALGITGISNRPVVIDCVSFGLETKGRRTASKVVLYNPAEWHR